MELLRAGSVFGSMRLLAALLWGASILYAAECASSSLGEKERLQKYRELDRAAQTAFDHGQFAVAAEQYREAICLVPKSARAFYGLGLAEAAAGKFAEARTALETADTILPGNVMPLVMLVRVDVAMKDMDAVKEILRLAAQRFPADAAFHSGVARFLAENQLLDLALAESLRAEQAGSNDPSSAVALAVLENTVGAYGDAIRHAREIEEQGGAPGAVKAAAAGVAGLSYESSGRRDEAIQHLKLALQLAPSQENSYLALAYLYEKAGHFKDAAAVLEDGRKQIPGSVNLLLPFGNNLVWSEQYQAGIEVLQDLIRRQPNTPEAYVRLAEAYRNTGHPERETQILQKLATVQPDYPMLGVLAARAMMGQDPVDYPAVLRILTQAEKTSPGDADIFYLRGKAYAATGRNQEAVTALRRAIELRSMDPAPYYQLGLVYNKMGQQELSRQMLRRMEHVKALAKTP